eukprot:TRINITY_DN4908_c0_g1_i2.p2 TRINITY_DN4908_c0_g1~~TRINITY_DN4908_c0_g1_i2.p2  ORF type:complete len:159 (+),score=48.58 TRINITY_DN4908_c0_g1_i2:25-501(+)
MAATTPVENIFQTEAAAAAAASVQRKLPIPLWLLLVILVVGLWIFCAVVHVVIAEARAKQRINKELERMRDEAKKIRSMKISKKQQKEALAHLSNSSFLFAVPGEEDANNSASNNNKGAPSTKKTDAELDPVWTRPSSASSSTAQSEGLRQRKPQEAS